MMETNGGLVIIFLVGMTKKKIFMQKKQNLSKKLCPVCNKFFLWRKKWERDWDNVIYCSKRCQKKYNKIIYG